MKNILFTLIFYFSASSLWAQESGHEISHYLFAQFNEGVVKQKSGEENKVSLNYNTITQEMIFENGDQKLALDKIENIDTVEILSRKFVPVEKVFYEVITNTPNALFIQYEMAIIPPGSETGFGKSQAGAITNVSDLKSSGKLYQLKLPEDYTLRSKNKYWLKKDDQYINIKNAKDVKNVFTDKAAAISDYLKTNKVNFKNTKDVIGLIQFCNN
jgi:hypothetical protein